MSKDLGSFYRTSIPSKYKKLGPVLSTLVKNLIWAPKGNYGSVRISIGFKSLLGLGLEKYFQPFFTKHFFNVSDFETSKIANTIPCYSWERENGAKAIFCICIYLSILENAWISTGLALTSQWQELTDEGLTLDTSAKYNSSRCLTYPHQLSVDTIHCLLYKYVLFLFFVEFWIICVAKNSGAAQTLHRTAFEVFLLLERYSRFIYPRTGVINYVDKIT